MSTNLFLGPGALFVFRPLADIREDSCSFVAKILFEIYSLRDGAVIVRRLAAEMFKQSETGEPILTAGRRLGHDRFDPDGAQRRGDLFHLTRTTFSVFDDAPDHVTRELLPIHSWERLVECGEDAFVRAVRDAAQHAFEHQRFEPFDDDAPTHLDGGGGADTLGDYFELHAVRREQTGELRRMSAAQEHRHGGPVTRHRRHDRGLDKTRAARLDQFSDRPFERRRNRIQIGVNVPRGEKLGGLFRGLHAAVRGHSRKQNVASRGQLRVRFEQRDPSLAGPPLNLLAQPRRVRIDVIGADTGDARAAQVFRDMKPSFAETDKAYPYLVVHSGNKTATEPQSHRATLCASVALWLFRIEASSRTETGTDSRRREPT